MSDRSFETPLTLSGPCRAPRQMGRQVLLGPILEPRLERVESDPLVGLDRELDVELRRRQLGAEMLLQIHDELVLEVPDGEFEEVAALTKQIMENVIELKVPLKVDCRWGTTWAKT